MVIFLLKDQQGKWLTDFESLFEGEPCRTNNPFKALVLYRANERPFTDNIDRVTLEKARCADLLEDFYISVVSFVESSNPLR